MYLILQNNSSPPEPQNKDH